MHFTSGSLESSSCVVFVPHQTHSYTAPAKTFAGAGSFGGAGSELKSQVGRQPSYFYLLPWLRAFRPQSAIRGTVKRNLRPSATPSFDSPVAREPNTNGTSAIR